MVNVDSANYFVNNEHEYEYIKNNETRDINNLVLRDICHLCFVDNDMFFKRINDDNDIYNFRPVFSHYNGNNNYILFVGEVSFWLVQRVSFAFMVIFPKHKIIVHRGKKDNKLLAAIKDINFFVKKELTLLEDPFFYLMNGYSRPYHYFYDTMQSYSYWDLSKFSKLLDLKDTAYLPSSVLDVNISSEVISQSEINSYLLKNNAIGFTASSVPSIGNISFIESFSKYMLSKTNLSNEKISDLENKNILIWIGICQESRCWIEQKEALVKLIKDLNHCYKDILFIFDGLTCPHYLNSTDFITRKCSKETELLDNIIKESGLTSKDYFSLIGAKALEKINISHNITFFISDALTDSIWPASFGRKPGVAYSIERAKAVHFHPKTYFIPNEEIKEIGDGTGNWSRVSFSIDPNFFVEYTLNALSKTIDLS